MDGAVAHASELRIELGVLPRRACFSLRTKGVNSGPDRTNWLSWPRSTWTPCILRLRFWLWILDGDASVSLETACGSGCRFRVCVTGSDESQILHPKSSPWVGLICRTGAPHRRTAIGRAVSSLQQICFEKGPRKLAVPCGTICRSLEVRVEGRHLCRSLTAFALAQPHLLSFSALRWTRCSCCHVLPAKSILGSMDSIQGVIKDAPLTVLGRKRRPKQELPQIFTPILRLERQPQVKACPPLSPVQVDLLSESFLSYFVSWQRLFNGILPRDLLRVATSALQIKHSTLRTTFVTSDLGIQQVVNPSCFEVVDTVGASSLEEAHKLAKKFARAPLDLSQEAPFRVLLVEIQDDAPKCLLAVKVHHATFDGLSMLILDRELFSLPSSPCPPNGGPRGIFYAVGGLSDLLEALSLRPSLSRPQFLDYLSWMFQEYLPGEDARRDRLYWKRQQKSLRRNPVPGIPTDRPRPRGISDQPHIERMELDLEPLTRKFCGSSSSFNVLLATVSWWYCCCSAQEEVVIGGPVHGRPIGRFTDVVGCFAHLIPYIIRMPRPFSFERLYNSVEQAVQEAVKHGLVPLKALDLEVVALNCIVNWEPRGSWREKATKSADWGAIEFIGPSPVMADVMVNAFESNESLQVQLGLNPTVFSRSREREMVSALAEAAEKGLPSTFAGHEVTLFVEKLCEKPVIFLKWTDSDWLALALFECQAQEVLKLKHRYIDVSVLWLAWLQ